MEVGATAGVLAGLCLKGVIVGERCPTCLRPWIEKTVVKRFKKPEPHEVTQYAREIGFILDGKRFCDYYESKGWVVGKSPMKNWKAAVKTWKGQATPDKLIQQGTTPEEKEKQMALKIKEQEDLKERLYQQRMGGA